jgi:hypothetical protein
MMDADKFIQLISFAVLCDFGLKHALQSNFTVLYQHQFHTPYKMLKPAFLRRGLTLPYPVTV